MNCFSVTFASKAMHGFNLLKRIETNAGVIQTDTGIMTVPR